MLELVINWQTVMVSFYFFRLLRSSGTADRTDWREYFDVRNRSGDACWSSSSWID
jgi:hypothetical protein